MISKREKSVLLMIITILALFPFFTESRYVLHVVILVFLYAILAQSWNLVAGYAGVLSLGTAGFLGIGAYSSALVSMRLGVTPWASFLIGGGIAAALGFLVCIPCLRLRQGSYIALVTLGFSEIARATVSNWVDLTRGQLTLWGIPSFPPINVPFISIAIGGETKMGSYYLLLAMLLVTTFVFYKLVKSRTGLKFTAVRDDQDAAEALGIDVSRNKLIAFTLSCFFIGIAGGLYAHYIMILSPDLLSIGQTSLVLSMVFIGGIGTLYGPIIGAFILIPASEILRFLGEGRFLVYGAMLVLVILFFPRGIVSILDHVRGCLRKERKKLIEPNKVSRASENRTK